MEVQAVVVDGDNTLWRGRAAEGIGRTYLKRELLRGNLATFLRGIKGKMEVEWIVSMDGKQGQANGQRRFYEILIENGLGTKPEMALFAGHYIASHIIPQTDSLVMDYLKRGTPVFLSTASGTSAANYARALYVPRMSMAKKSMDGKSDGKLKFTFSGVLSNTERFDEAGKLVEFISDIMDGESKLALTEQMLDKFGIKVSDCLVVGDSDLDLPLLMSARIPIASPLANDKVRRFSKCVIPQDA